MPAASIVTWVVSLEVPSVPPLMGVSRIAAVAGVVLLSVGY